MSELLHVRLEVADVLDEEVFRELPVHLNAAVEQQALFQFEISCWSVNWTRARRILCVVSLLLFAFVFGFNHSINPVSPRSVSSSGACSATLVHHRDPVCFVVSVEQI